MDRDEQIAALFGRWKSSAARNAAAPEPETLCADCPELLEEFRRRLPSLVRLDQLFGGEFYGLSASDAPTRYHVPGYESFHFHREGGLSVVLKARDADLGRDVAVKWMKDHVALDPVGRRRFLQEAEITAALDHPGIIPIYARGRDADGRHYYVMRFVNGATLQEAIEGYHAGDHASEPLVHSTDFRRMIRAFIQVCETVAYAHARGIMHRDLKPANLMLGEYQETLVLDWGLAKRTDRQAAPKKIGGASSESAGASASEPEASELSVSEALDSTGGDPLASQPGRSKGTPGFMSPEQAAGDDSAVGPASDIYSLGATLYAVLTGRAPYRGMSGEEVVAKVRTGEFEPPARINPQISDALNAVCVKAMAKSTAARYTDPRELAADLELWLADEPVGAWPEPLSLRARRWMHRHRATVATSALGLVFTTLAAVVIAFQADRSARREHQAHVELAGAEAELRKSYATATEHLARAREAAKSVTSLLNLAATSHDAGRNDLKVQLIRQALEINARLAAEFPDEPAYRTEDTRAKWYLGLHNSLAASDLWQSDRLAAGLERFEEADRMFRELAAVDASNPEYRDLYAIHARLWGMLLANEVVAADERGEFERALSLSPKLIALWEKRSELAPDTEGRETLTRARLAFAVRCRDRITTGPDAPADEIARAVERYEGAIEGLDRLPEADRTKPPATVLRGVLQLRLETLSAVDTK